MLVYAGSTVIGYRRASSNGTSGSLIHFDSMRARQRNAARRSFTVSHQHIDFMERNNLPRQMPSGLLTLQTCRGRATEILSLRFRTCTDDRTSLFVPQAFDWSFLYSLCVLQQDRLIELRQACRVSRFFELLSSRGSSPSRWSFKELPSVTLPGSLRALPAGLRDSGLPQDHSRAPDAPG
jgi:hypothetical protein